MAKQGHSNLSDVDPSKKLLTDASSLVDLKAEVFRKYQEAQFNKIHGKKEINQKSSGSSRVWSKSNIGLESRRQRDEQVSREQEGSNNENENKVKAALEEKARFYEKLKSGQVQDEDRFLVQFNKNQEEGSSEDEEDKWVDYTDFLGRTRTCMRKDLKGLKKQDKEWKRDACATSMERDVEVLQATGAEGGNPDLMSEDMRREMLRQKWEQEEEENLKKTKLHYNDVLFDEARTHGAGFYRFSREEAARASQQEELSKLHEETTRSRNMAKTDQKKKKTALEIRLKKVRDRKRLKMGLPIAMPDDEDEKNGTEDMEGEDETKEQTLEESVMQGLKALREEREEKEKEVERSNFVREWDVGKDGVKEQKFVMKGEKKILSQKEWVQEKRQVRPSEFAPPQAYAKSDSQPKKQRNVDSSRNVSSSNFSNSRTNKSCGSNFDDIRLPDVSKPPPSSPKGPKMQKFDPMANLDQNCGSTKIGPSPRPDDHNIDNVEKKRPRMSLQDRLNLHFEDTRPPGTSDFDSFSEERAAPTDHVEIAPPCSMDYFSSSGFQSKTFSREKFFKSRQDMSEAFTDGLQSLSKRKYGQNNVNESDSE